MSLMLKLQRNGTLRPFWYGVFTEAGKRRVINLNVPICGTPPASLAVGDAGDPRFEKSRESAAEALEKHVEEAGHKGRAEHLTERLIESKTGRSVQYARLGDLSARWRSMGRKVRAGEAHLANCDAHFRRFTAFMRNQNPAAVHLYQVTPEDASAFVTYLRRQLAPATAQYATRLLAKAMSRFLPVGAVNPFAEFVGGRANVESGVIHRKSFTPHELQALLTAAAADEFMHPLIVTAACTGMRRGDVCELRWSAIDLAGGMLTVKTSKTGKKAEIPIFPPLRAVLEPRQDNGSEYVFPSAVRMLRDSPRTLSWRFKKLAVEAIEGHTRPNPPPRVPAADVEAEGVAAIGAKMSDGARRDRMLDTFRRYCAAQSVRQIEKATDRPRATVSNDLHAVQDMIGKSFLPAPQEPSITGAVARVTRLKREHGQKSASIRDWHALRTTYVTLALSAGVPVELVRRVTGHATVQVVLENYFRPDCQQFRAALAGAMPDILTGGKPAKVKPTDELAALAGKLAAGTATHEDKARFRKLAVRV